MSVKKPSVDDVSASVLSSSRMSTSKEEQQQQQPPPPLVPSPAQRQSIVQARREAALIEEQYGGAVQRNAGLAELLLGCFCAQPMNARARHVTCVPTGRTYLIASMLALAVGWTLFFVAVVTSSVYTRTHPMRGYEWLPGIVVAPLTLFAFCYMPRMDGWHLAGPDERSVHETAINLRIGLVILLVTLGVAGGLILVVIEWMVPPPHCHSGAAASADAVAVAALHSSPSPSAAPSTSSGHSCGTDTLTGTLLCSHYLALACSVLFGWLAAVTPSSAALSEGDDSDVGIPMGML